VATDLFGGDDEPERELTRSTPEETRPGRSEAAPDVEAVLGAVEQATASGDGAAFDTPDFAAAQGRYHPYVAEACYYTPTRACPPRSRPDGRC
jgi:hypothetical protein